MGEFDVDLRVWCSVCHEVCIGNGRHGARSPRPCTRCARKRSADLKAARARGLRDAGFSWAVANGRRV